MYDLESLSSLALDTDCLIYLTESKDQRSHWLAELMRQRRESALLVSTATVAEALTGLLRKGGRADAGLAVIRLLPGIRIVPLTESIAVRTARIRAETNLKLPDAIHVASAIEAGAEGFLTNDRELQRAEAVLPIYILDDIIEGKAG